MEQEMRQFFDMKIQRENLNRQAKRQFSSNHYQEIMQQNSHQRKLSSIKQIKAKKSKQFNQNIGSIYLQAQLRDYNKFVTTSDKIEQKWHKSKPHWVDEQMAIRQNQTRERREINIRNQQDAIQIMNAIHARKQDKMKDKMEQVYSKFTTKVNSPVARNQQYSTEERL